MIKTVGVAIWHLQNGFHRNTQQETIRQPHKEIAV